MVKALNFFGEGRMVVLFDFLLILSATAPVGWCVAFVGKRVLDLLMGHITAGLVSITFRKLAPLEIIQLVSKAELDAIEWGGDVHVPHGDVQRAKEVAEMTAEAGLKVAAYGSYYRVGNSEKDGLNFARVLDSATALGAPLIRVWAGVQGSAQAEPSYRDWVTGECRRIAAAAAERGVVVACEYHARTLTDDRVSALRLLREVDHPNFKSLWQPSNGMELAGCWESLEAISPWLTNLHVFHWWPDSSHRLALSEGVERWKAYLKKAQSVAGDRCALLEFIPGDSQELFLKDAKVLRGWLKEIA
jgi:3-dehydroshikimate dehydratase